MSNFGSKIISAIRKKSENMESEMSFFDHIEALRWHLIRASIAIVVFTIIIFVKYTWVYDTIIMGPSRPTFWTYKMMCHMGDFFQNLLPSVFSAKDFCISKINIKLINTEMAGQFTLQINSSLIIGMTLGIPYLLWELWRFIRPALHEKERKAASGFVFYASFLFVLGVLFGYYVIAPMSINFLSSYTVSSTIENLFSIDSYISSVATLTLATGVVFQLPILVFILSNLGILTAKFMRDKRRYAIVIIVSIPLFVLYEVGIVVAIYVEKRKKARRALLDL
jgi:sec-independent protein translocase protein TatC